MVKGITLAAMMLLLAACETVTYTHYGCYFFFDLEADTVGIESDPPGGEEYCEELIEEARKQIPS
jgi:D-serine deaminase-like pyridoxal phosphate-dependent protein